MPAPSPSFSSESLSAERIARLEARVAAIEERLAQAGWVGGGAAAAADDVGGPFVPIGTKGGEALEYEVGENWFARVGILALAIGGVFTLSLPYGELPAFLPSVVGYAVAAALFWVAHRWQRMFELVANYFRGAAMALLWFATIRLAFFGAQSVLGRESVALVSLLVAVVICNLAIAFRRKSPHLATLALATGYGSAIAVGSAWLVLPTVIVLPVVATLEGEKLLSVLPVLAATVLSYATYLAWAIGNPIHGGGLHFVAGPGFAPAIPLAAALVLVVGRIERPGGAADAIVATTHAGLNCALGYGVFLVHTAAVFITTFAFAHVAASLVFLSSALLFWIRLRCAASTFFYAMTGYAALSIAIIHASAIPNVFVWLSLESIVVVATAVWFQSRFIVVANFLIYVGIVLGYEILKERETGISLAIGVVALLSARILNWQKDRLQLKTELMRNAYLFSGFVVFPYALYHLVPPRYVGLAWVGLAVVYYTLNLIVRSPKYRWMGHATLLLTSVYLLMPGAGTVDPVYRVLSFLALGTVLLVVSLTFSRLRSRAAERPPPS